MKWFQVTGLMISGPTEETFYRPTGVLPGNKHATDTPLLAQAARKANKRAPEIHPKSRRKIEAWTNVSLLVLPIAPGSSQGPPSCQNGRNRLAKWQVWATQITISVPKSSKNHKSYSDEHWTRAGGRWRSQQISSTSWTHSASSCLFSIGAID